MIDKTIDKTIKQYDTIKTHKLIPCLSGRMETLLIKTYISQLDFIIKPNGSQQYKEFKTNSSIKTILVIIHKK